MNDSAPTIQPAADLAKLIELSRGILHGIALGDAADHLLDPGPVRPAGVSTQLTLASAEGMIRTMERAGRSLEHDWGFETLSALRRWALAQGIEGITRPRPAGTSLLNSLPGYAARRGSAPATVRALRHHSSPGSSLPPSFGAHAVVRTLPYAVLVAMHGPDLAWPAIASARSTHAHPLIPATVVAAVRFGSALAQHPGHAAAALLDEVERLRGEEAEGSELVATRLGTAVTAAATTPQDPKVLAGLVPDRSALSVLTAAVYVALSHPEPERFPLAMALAAFAPDKTSVSALAGGLLGAMHGSTPLLSFGAARGELAWACDALGTDVAMTSMLTPLGHEPGGEPWLPSWPARYPI
ncbi:ADP-ribosylglycohydrolase family protein [Ornithinimicrobium panacihumi]|uniref:ADP-ribosylglycohydrolase family protein n=1 Tax=Ornithinimicrobium panacihumi TaxID=2008449 RepID=UPI003F89D2B8